MAQDKEMMESSSAPRPTSRVQFSGGPISSRYSPPLIWRIIDFIIGGVFIYAGVVKAMEPLVFANDIENYHVLPWAIGVRLAFYLPWLEILCGLALITRRLYSGAVSILLGLMLVFIAATIAAKVRGIDITCGSFGHASKNLSFSWHMVLDLAILGALIALGLSNSSQRGTRG